MIARRGLPLLLALPALPALAQPRERRRPPAETPPPAPEPPASIQPPADHHWRVMRNGSEIGSHNVTFSARGDELVSVSDVTVVPRVLGVVVYRFEHRYTEITRGQGFVSIRSRLNRNGSVVEVSAEAGPGGVAVSGPAGMLTLPANAAPLSWWQPHRFGGAVPIFGSSTGRLMELRWAREARAAGGVRWRCFGEVEAVLDYDATGRWVGYSVLGDDGSTVSYSQA